MLNRLEYEKESFLAIAVNAYIHRKPEHWSTLMIKKVLIFFAVTALFVITSCGPSTSPQKSYAAEMSPAIELLNKWQADYTALEALLTDTLSGSSATSRLQMIELYNIATELQITRDDYMSLGFSPLDDLVSPSVKFSKDGHAILDIISDVIPVEETETVHQSVLKCVQTRVLFAEELSAAIKKLGPIDMSKAGALSSCDTFEASLETLTAFIEEHK